MKKCTCMGEDAYICQCHYDMIQKELVKAKADRDNWKKNHVTLRKEYKALEKELINLRGEFKRTDNLIKTLYDKTIGKHPF